MTRTRMYFRLRKSLSYLNFELSNLNFKNWSSSNLKKYIRVMISQRLPAMPVIVSHYNRDDSLPVAQLLNLLASGWVPVPGQPEWDSESVTVDKNKFKFFTHCQHTVYHSTTSTTQPEAQRLVVVVLVVLAYGSTSSSTYYYWVKIRLERIPTRTPSRSRNLNDGPGPGTRRLINLY